jgi:glycosyltransferase involved in cell wall biosynthesis
MTNTLVFFSTQYPYETTLKNEFKVLSKKFDKVYYFPTSIIEANADILPSNIELNPLLANNRDKWKTITLKSWFLVFGLYLTESFKKGNLFAYLKNPKIYISIAGRNVKWANLLEHFIKENNLSDAVFYDYWFENATLSLAILKKRKAIKKFSCRIHGFDLYDERWDGVVPYRDYKMKYVDAVYAVSRYGQNYLKNKISNIYKSKVRLSYLGVEMPSVINPKSNYYQEKIIVSASNTQDFKRVHHIPDVLSKLDFPVRWIHFGSGLCDNVLKENIKNLPLHIKVELKGHVPNDELINFYANQHVDLFISLSTSEGLPISMMEVISYGIPVFAGNICGIPDLVNDTTGVMFELNDSFDIITEKLKNALNKKFDTEKIAAFARIKFYYEQNYREFLQNL